MSIRNYENEWLGRCNFGDQRLTARALHIGDCLRLKYGQPLSKVFKNASELKRAYEFLANPRTSFKKVVESSHHQTANYVRNLPIILSIGDTTSLDYKNIKYHKILKSGCKVESYRLGGSSMEVLLGFLTRISSNLLRMTYLHRNHPESPAEAILTPVQIKVLKAKSSQTKTRDEVATIRGAIQAIARLGGYARA